MLNQMGMVSASAKKCSSSADHPYSTSSPFDLIYAQCRYECHYIVLLALPSSALLLRGTGRRRLGLKRSRLRNGGQVFSLRNGTHPDREAHVSAAEAVIEAARKVDLKAVEVVAVFEVVKRSREDNTTPSLLL